MTNIAIRAARDGGRILMRYFDRVEDAGAELDRGLEVVGRRFPKAVEAGVSLSEQAGSAIGVLSGSINESEQAASQIAASANAVGG